MTKVLIAGTFDFFHEGHKNFIEQASKLGDELHVIIARDSSVKKIKKKIPTQTEKTRFQQILSWPLVTKAYLGDDKDFMKIPLQINPEIIAIGYDQEIPNNLKENFEETQIIRLKPFQEKKYKSSLLRKIQKAPI